MEDIYVIAKHDDNALSEVFIPVYICSDCVFKILSTKSPVCNIMKQYSDGFYCRHMFMRRSSS